MEKGLSLRETQLHYQFDCVYSTPALQTYEGGWYARKDASFVALGSQRKHKYGMERVFGG